MSTQQRSYTGDLIRTIAIVMVVLCHCRYLNLAPTEYVYATFFMNVGVDMFLTLSGFLLTYLYLGKIKKVDEIRYFYQNRWLKTIPPYILFCAITMILQKQPIENLLYYVLFIQNYFIPTEWFISWSLCLDEWFYLFFPFFLFMFRQQPFKMMKLFIVLSLAILGWRSLIYINTPNISIDWFQSSFYYQTHLRLDSVFLGAVFAVLRVNTPPARDHKPWLFLVLGLILVYVPYIFGDTSRLGFFAAVVHPFLVASGTGTWLYYSWGYSSSKFRSFLEMGSNISYIAYLAHIPIILLIEKLKLNFSISLILVLMTVLSVSLFLNRYFEFYFLAMKSTKLRK